MDPSVSAKVEGEPKERKKIHFAVPASAPPNLDPRQVEMTTSDLDSASGEQREIRRRRPTPATLFRVADQSSPEDDQSTHQWVVGENGVLKPKRVSPNVYQPPSLKAVQKMAEAQMQKLGVYPPLEDPREGEEDEDLLEGEDRDQPTEQTDSLSGVRGETAKQIQTAPEEDEEEEEEDRRKSDATTEENSRGSY